MFEIIMLGFGLLWFVSFAIDARKLRNGFYFMVSYVSLFSFLILYTNNFEGSLWAIMMILLLVIPLLIIYCFFAFLLISMFVTSVKLIKNEGFSFSNILGILFGLLMVAWYFILPFLQVVVTESWQRVFFLMLTVYVTSFFFMYAVFTIAAITYAWKPKRKKTNDYIIVLGAGLIDGQRVTPLLASRIDKAIARYNLQIQKGGQPPLLIMSGGQGSDERISEAEAMHRYALEQGVPKMHMAREEQSTNTYENMWYSKQIIDERFGDKAKGLFATNNFHVFRSALFARMVGLRADGIGSKTKFYYFLNATVREFIGVMSLHKRGLIILFILTMLGAILGYFLLEILMPQLMPMDTELAMNFFITGYSYFV